MTMTKEVSTTFSSYLKPGLISEHGLAHYKSEYDMCMLSKAKLQAALDKAKANHQKGIAAYDESKGISKIMAELESLDAAISAQIEKAVKLAEPIITGAKAKGVTATFDIHSHNIVSMRVYCDASAGSTPKVANLYKKVQACATQLYENETRMNEMSKLTCVAKWHNKTPATHDEFKEWWLGVYFPRLSHREDEAYSLPSEERQAARKMNQTIHTIASWEASTSGYYRTNPMFGGKLANKYIPDLSAKNITIHSRTRGEIKYLYAFDNKGTLLSVLKYHATVFGGEGAEAFFMDGKTFYNGQGLAHSCDTLPVHVEAWAAML